ncbi:MAG: hypothetical protein K2X39_02050, partial [Silvanigrellaceae bacterium]|nr:hypothetical protein [Silvanigrellaceae bacterium]
MKLFHTNFKHICSFFSNYLLILNIFLVSLCPRIDDIFNIHFFQPLISKSLKLGLIVALLYGARYLTRFTLSILFLIAAILLHSYAHLYYPSLSLDILKMDYRISDYFSSNFLFDWAKLYIKHFCYFFFPFLVFYHSNREKNKSIVSHFQIVLIFTFLINIIVTLLQRFYSLDFLSAKSGSALGAL